MGSIYLNPTFTTRIQRSSIKTIIECGSRDCLDAIELLDWYYPDVLHAFECNPESIPVCRKNIVDIDNIILHTEAICAKDAKVDFYATGMKRSIDKNIGASSLLFHIDNEVEFIQKLITVQGIRLDTFMKRENINKVDLMCFDLQGAEHLAIEGLGERIKDVHYIISEVSFSNFYHGNILVRQLKAMLAKKEFVMVACDSMPMAHEGFGNALFINKDFKK
jgi:FkbM family methyltransferase